MPMTWPKCFLLGYQARFKVWAPLILLTLEQCRSSQLSTLSGYLTVPCLLGECLSHVKSPLIFVRLDVPGCDKPLVSNTWCPKLHKVIHADCLWSQKQVYDSTRILTGDSWKFFFWCWLSSFWSSISHPASHCSHNVPLLYDPWVWSNCALKSLELIKLAI